MRVLMTVTSTSLADGINRHILAIAPEMARRDGVEVRVVTVHPWGDFNDELTRRGIKTYSLESPNGHRVKVLTGFCRIMREYRPDIVHAHISSLMAGLALKWVFRRVKLVTTIHGLSDPRCELPLKRRAWFVVRDALFSLCHRKCDFTFAISEGVRRACGGDAVAYNPICFNTDGSAIPRIMERSALVIGTACRVVEVKNPRSFTRVMKGVCARLPEVEAQIIGSAVAGQAESERLFDDMKAIAADEPRVKFLGYRTDAPALIAKMNVFVMTSRREGLPTALLEAMAAKTPIAFMDGDGGLSDLAELNRKEGPFAVVAPQGDEQALIDGIVALLKDPARAQAYADRAYEVARRHFDVVSIVDGMVARYGQMIKRVGQESRSSGRRWSDNLVHNE